MAPAGPIWSRPFVNLRFTTIRPEQSSGLGTIARVGVWSVKVTSCASWRKPDTGRRGRKKKKFRRLTSYLSLSKNRLTLITLDRWQGIGRQITQSAGNESL